MAKLKHIVFTVTNDLNYDQRMQRICTTLVQAGYDITLVGFIKKRSVPLQQQAYKQHRIFVFFKTGKLFFLEYNMRLFFYLLWKRFDIYGPVDLDTILPGAIIAKLKNKPVVYDAHEYYEELPEVIDRPLIQKFWKLVARVTLPHIKYNYTVSQSIADDLSKKYKQPYAVIRNVPELKTSSIDHQQKQHIILYQGAINKGRGLEQLIDAMENIDAKLVIAGEGDLSAEIREKAAGKYYSDKIEFAGMLNPETLKKKTQSAMVGINLVAPIGLSYYYSLSNKFFDYIHAGIPQITMDFPEYARINDQYQIAVLIKELRSEEISEAILSLISNSQLYDQLVANTQRAKLDLNWGVEQQKLIEFYQHVA